MTLDIIKEILTEDVVRKIESLIIQGVSLEGAFSVLRIDYRYYTVVQRGGDTDQWCSNVILSFRRARELFLSSLVSRVMHSKDAKAVLGLYMYEDEKVKPGYVELVENEIDVSQWFQDGF